MNNTLYIPLASLMVQGRPLEQPVGLQASGRVSWQRFYDRVAQLARVLSLRPERRWALLHADSVEFSIQLLALLHAGKQVVLPPNPQCVQHKTMSDVVDAVLDVSLVAQAQTQSPSFSFQLLREADVYVYTSGSTGQPKGVRKTLEQLEQEVLLLENHFGAALGAGGVFGSAPPHHMYGFTFRVLWPLVSGRVIDGTLCQNPDMLAERGLVFPQGVMVASPAQLSRWPEWLSSGSLLPKPRLLLSAGGGLESSVVEWLQQRLGVWPVEIYGSSETGVIAWRQGKQVAWTPFQGVSVEADSTGAALVRSPLLGAQASCRIEDAVEVLPQGGFHLKGRLDRTVKIEEKRLFLPDMEACFERHAWVRACRLLLIPGARQVLGAVVVLSPEGKACLNDSGKWAMTQVFRRDLSLSFDRVLMPRRWRFVAHLPLTERGKIDTRALMDLFQDES